MTTCYSCSKSYSVCDEYGYSVLVCKPTDDSKKQVAEIVCLKYVREIGADEKEDCK